MAYGLEERQTIFAMATAVGKAAVAIVRVSGPRASKAIELLAGRLPQPRKAVFRTIRDPENGEIIDNGLVLWFPGPQSFTGEDSAEFQVHGARAVVAAMLRVLGKLKDMRLAEPGEFSRRALQNGKMDVIAIEALGDLIEAETEQQRRLAVIETFGALRKTAERWRSRLIDALALIEGELDFSEEAEVGAESLVVARKICSEILDELSPDCLESQNAERLRDGMVVLITGPPNSGKSTLLNAMARRDVAIVSERAGTTRDLIDVKLDLDGYPLSMVDTAGMRESDDPIEQEGICRALKKSEAADLILWLTPVNEGYSAPPPEFRDRRWWSIRTKADRAEARRGSEGRSDDENASNFAGKVGRRELEISAKTGRNFDQLIDLLKAFASENMSVDSSLVIANARQRRALIAAREALDAAVVCDNALEIVAEEIRRACFSLDSLAGKVGVEDVLDRLFSRFCIGK